MNIKFTIIAAAIIGLLPGCWSRKQHKTVITTETVRGSGPEHWGDSVIQELEDTDPIK